MLNAAAVHARLALDTAQVAHNEAADRAMMIDARILASNERKTAITAARISGTGTEAQAHEFVCLSADIEELQKMAEYAHALAADLYPTRQISRLHDAEHTLHLHVERELYAALKQAALKLETALIALIQRMHNEGPQHGLGSICKSWRPSQQLSNAVAGSRI